MDAEHHSVDLAARPEVPGARAAGSERNEMSRTDKTKPPWVRHAEHHPLPVHDHRDGACDLPPRPTREDTDTRCRWAPTLMALITRPCCAGCKVRSHIRERQEWARAANRRERYTGRREARRFAAAGATGD
ncbi:hypothetical protein [Streptomyces sp. S4.7]|uniref:hypothetical protein n=1 Tax=Streptomyces sp. S4.7 TaxID=2705439 RepID=UPI001EF30584|nr:hypothetical protein [Streptomyces sp. S4.7]